MLSKAIQMQDQLSELRRTFHRHPELSFQETKTAEFIADRLGELGMTVQTGIAKTGVVAYMGQDSPTIALRADMDALPITEVDDRPHRSQVPGVMHACGHDAHMACVLGAAMLLSGTNLPGRVCFVFQPSEEKMDDEGKSGAMRMVEEGVMDDLDAIVGLHVATDVLAGDIAISEGPTFGGLDYFTIHVLGQSAHGACPHQGIDAIQLASQVVTGLNSIVSRRIDPMQTSVISPGMIHGGSRPNILADRVTVKGTLRYFDEQVQAQLLEEIEAVCRTTHGLGGDYELTIGPRLLVTNNDAEITALVRSVGQDLLGANHVHAATPTLLAEDFSYFGREKPATYFRLGVRTEEESPILHSPTFDIDESCLPVGAAVLAETARRYLEDDQK
jgi:amidohydrolase